MTGKTGIENLTYEGEQGLRKHIVRKTQKLMKTLRK